MSVLSVTSFSPIKVPLAILLVAVAASIFCPPAKAHSVFVFAWVDGDRICTESYFSKKSKVRGGTIKMLNAQGKELQNGITDENGIFCFSPPQEAADLTFVIEAGEGHRGEFRLTAADLTDTGLNIGEKNDPQVSEQEQVPPLPMASIDEIALRQIIREELQAQLSPVRKMLAESENDQEPGSREVVGGLGWLAGLAGFSLWLTNRKNKSRP